jgi:hypothetical protein
VTPLASFAVEAGKTVLVLTVPKGPQPVYYCHNVPYIRHLTASRPAEAHEVIDLVTSWLQGPAAETGGDGEEVAFLLNVGDILTNLLIFAEEVDQRNVNPWLELLMAEFANAAKQLRERAASEYADKLGLSTLLETAADNADRVGHYHHVLGRESWEMFTGLVKATSQTAEEIKKKRVDAVPPPSAALEWAKEALLQGSRCLEGLKHRAKEMASTGRIADAQQEAAEVGLKLLHAAHFGLDRALPDFRRALKEVGLDLHLLETVRVHLDGGRSVQAILDKISSASDKLRGLAERLESGDAFM